MSMDPRPGAVADAMRVVVCDDHPILRAALCELIAAQPDVAQVIEASSGREVLDCVRRGGCDVVLLDVAMPGQNGIDVLRAIRLRDRSLPVLMFSAAGEAQFALHVIRLGAQGYLNKSCRPDELLHALRTVARGKRHLTAPVAALLAGGLDAQAADPSHAQLSDRELQVFLRLARGETVTAIGQALCLSFKTVSTYRSRVLDKLQLRTNSDVTYYAMKQGLIE